MDSKIAEIEKSLIIPKEHPNFKSGDTITVFTR